MLHSSTGNPSRSIQCEISSPREVDQVAALQPELGLNTLYLDLCRLLYLNIIDVDLRDVHCHVVAKTGRNFLQGQTSSLDSGQLTSRQVV